MPNYYSLIICPIPYILQVLIGQCYQCGIEWGRDTETKREWQKDGEREMGLKEETDRTGSILKAGLHLGPNCRLWAICPVSMEMTYQWKTRPLDEGASGLVPRLSIAWKNMLIISVTEQGHKSHYAYWGMITGLLINVHCLTI